MRVPLAPVEYEFPDGLEFEEEGHIYRFNGERVVSVSQVLSSLGVLSYPQNSATGYALLRGRRVHEICEMIDCGKWDGTDDQFDEKMFLDYALPWSILVESSGLKIVGIEVPVYSPAQMCAGRIDRIVIDKDGKTGILDIKTGTLNDVSWVQVAGYSILSRDCGINPSFISLVSLPGGNDPRGMLYRCDGREMKWFEEVFIGLRRSYHIREGWDPDYLMEIELGQKEESDAK